MLFLLSRAEGSGFRNTGLTGVESSSTAKVFMAFMEVSIVEFGTVVAAVAALGSVAGLAGVVIFSLLCCVLKNVGVWSGGDVE